MAAISVHNLSKSYGTVQVLRHMDLSVGDGEFVVLVGPSGCGKSTLLRLIAGLEQPTDGEIHIGNRCVNDLDPKDRDLAMVFQSYALYPHMTVRENMSFALRLRGVGEELIDAAVRAASEKLGLQTLLDRKPRALSGGQRQRVAMGRALVREPKAFLFDEPLSNLDARLREQMRFEIKKLQRELKTTAVYVTHDQVEAMTMADRIVAMNEGLVQQVGTPQELYEDPANVFVAGFIGSPAMNFVDVTVQPESDGISLMIGSTCLGKLRQPYALREDRRAIVGIRPERIEIAVASLGLPGKLEMIEPLGLGSVLHIRLGMQRLKAFTTESSPAEVNQPIGIAVAPANLLLFDPETGRRMRPRQ